MQKTVFTLLLSVIILSLSSCGHQEKEIKQKPRYVKISRVDNQENIQHLVFNGIIKENKLTTLSFRVGGPLVQLNVKPGDYVEKGQIIAKIDARDYEIQLQSTKAQYDQLKNEYGRYQQLLDKGKIPVNSYEKIKSGFLMAENAYNNAKNQLRDTELRAPYSGYIHEKMTENYQTVGPGQPIVSIIDLSKMEVVISVPENQILQVKNSSKNYLTVKNAQVENLEVELFSVSEKTMVNGLYEVKLAFKNKEKYQVSPGMTAEVRMELKSDRQALVVPSSALFYKNDQTCVWIYSGQTQTVSLKPIQVKGIITGDQIEVTGGLSVGDTVVTTGVTYLSEGQVVEPFKSPSKTNVGGLL